MSGSVARRDVKSLAWDSFRQGSDLATRPAATPMLSAAAA